MRDKLQFFISNRRWLASIIVIAAILVCTVLVIHAGNSLYIGYNSEVTDMNGGWSADDGEMYLLSELPNGQITLHCSAEGIDLKDRRFCMKSVDTFFQVLADGEVIYSFQPEQNALLGRSYGMYVHSVPVPENTGVLTLELTSIFEDSPPAILSAVIEDPGMFMCDLFNEGIPGFCICLLMMILGVIMIISGAFTFRTAGYRDAAAQSVRQDAAPSKRTPQARMPHNQSERLGKHDGQHIEVFTLGIFAVLVAIWSVNDTLILQILTQSPAIIRLLNYITLIFLPYFIVSFIASTTNKRGSPLLTVLFAIICINFVVNVSLTAAGISDYFELVKISQGVIVIALAMAAYFVISAVRHRQVEKRFLRIFVVGISSIALGAVIDLIIFRISSNVLQSTSLYARMGSLLFLILIGIHFIQENRRIQVENSRALEQLAYTDGLTGMKNRLAFNEAETSFAKGDNAKYMIIQFDINDLKKVNDVYGHAQGDRHISGAAGIIRDSVHGSGDCYRVGGDEFVAIISGNDAEAAAKSAIDQMERLTAEYNARENPPVMLDIAYGMAAFTAADGDLEKSARLADQRMYECKRVKKQRSGAADSH